jgi:hypothetical protein
MAQVRQMNVTTETVMKAESLEQLRLSVTAPWIYIWL